jgi:hypothetical protein
VDEKDVDGRDGDDDEEEDRRTMRVWVIVGWSKMADAIRRWRIVWKG